MNKYWGAPAEALSLMFISIGTGSTASLYSGKSHVLSWFTVGALVAIGTTILYTSLNPLFKRMTARGEAKQSATGVRPALERLKEGATELRGNKAYWAAAAFLLPSAFQSLTSGPAVTLLDVGTVATIGAMGPLSVGAWVLAHPRRGVFRPVHAGLPVVALGGIVLLTRPFTHGANGWGLVLAFTNAAVSGCYVVGSGRLNRMGMQNRAILMMRWCTVLFMAVPILLVTTEDWMSWRVLPIVAIAWTTATAAQFLHTWIAWRLTDSAGVIGMMSAAGPVFAALAGLLILGQGFPPMGWAGVGLVAVSTAALQFFKRGR